MTKAKQQEIIDEQKLEIETLRNELNEHAEQSKSGIWYTWDQDRHYHELQENTLKSIETADKMRDSNNELIKAIANLNGGVLKDLSQTIVNLTGRNQ